MRVIDAGAPAVYGRTEDFQPRETRFEIGAADLAS
jgi:hypothetical protein